MIEKITKLSSLKNLENKKIFLRLDLNVPLKNNNITDDYRITSIFKTINYLIEKKSKIVIFSHLSRPKTEKDKENMSLFPVFLYLKEKYKNVFFSKSLYGKEFENNLNNLKKSEILLVENTRFLDLEEKKESILNIELSKYWASKFDVFVNDAYATLHRNHTSICGVAKFIEKKAIGFLVEKEITTLLNIFNNPKKPFYVIFGGAKAADKLKVLKNLLPKVDKAIISGALAFTFWKSLGYDMGTSPVEDDQIPNIKEIWKKYKEKIILPTDFICAKTIFSTDYVEKKYDNIPKDLTIVDIGKESIDNIVSNLKNINTIFWNGPVGVFEVKPYDKGTFEISKKIAYLTKNENCFSIIGGGDSASAVKNFKLSESISFISTGGGASLVLAEGKELPGILALKKNY